jgi:hypothetical protein
MTSSILDSIDWDNVVDTQEEISKFIFTGKYARYREDLKRRETWDEAVERVESMHLRKFDQLLPVEALEEIRQAFDLVRDKRVAPSMRSMQFGGIAVEDKNARLYNCAVRHIDSIRSFAEVFYLLLCGCGVGLGLTKKYLNRLPDLVGAENRTGTVITYVVEDTIEGWSDSIEALLACYFVNTAYTGRKIVFDYSKIRPAGSKLKTGGGKAPGHEPLKAAHIRIKDLLNTLIEVKGQNRLLSVDAYDIVMHEADAVLSGGVRRSATSVMFSKDDREMINAKTGNWTSENPQRGRSNNSVLLLRDETSEEEFNDIYERTKEWGEPGFVWADSEDVLFNPCFEVSFEPVTDEGVCAVQFSVSGDTKLITREGLVDIKDAVGRDATIWNGDQWVTVKPYQTGKSDKLYRISFSDGSILDATNSHKFMVKAPHWKTYREMTTLEIRDYLANNKGGLHLPRPDVRGSNPEGIDVEYAYEYGFFKGDGHLDHGVPKFNLYNEDKQVGIRGFKYPKTYMNSYGTEYSVVRGDHLNEQFCKELKLLGLPREIATWSEKSFYEFMSGWVDADGSQANAGCRLYGDEESLRVAQILLTKFGTVSSLNLMSPAGVRTNLGERKSAVWYLQIPNASKIPSRRLNIKSGKDARYKGKWQYVRSVVELEGEHESFCLTEPNRNMCVFGNVLTKQCNLSTINGARINSEEEFYKAAEAAALIGTLQASYTDFPYLSKEAQQLTEEEALLGVSITGMFENPDVLLDPVFQRNASNVVVETNRRWAQMIGINPAARATVIKPEGTASLAFGTMASGIHPPHAPIMFRRIQVNKLDNVYQHFKMHNPSLCEESVWSANKTDDVVIFPVKVKEDSLFKRDISALEHLEIVKSTQQNWVIPGRTGHSKKHLCHNVSSTITVQPHEWDAVAKYIYDNRENFTAVSFIAASGDKDYPQAPNEAVATQADEEKFYNYLQNFIPVDYSWMEESEDNTDVQQEAACAGPEGCEVKIL